MSYDNYWRFLYGFGVWCILFIAYCTYRMVTG